MIKHKELIARLTLEEKASLTSGKDFWQTMDLPLQGVPSMVCSDGPSGLRHQMAAADHLGLNPSYPATCFPSSAALADSWDEALAERVGAALGREAASMGVHILLAPGMNIRRNPKCGRDFEYFSEDPYLAGKMAAGYVRGVQSEGVAATVKHFAVNNRETKRMVSDSVLDERTLREIYLTGFEIAVKEGRPRAVMSSYNRVNGVYANENRHLLRDILRGAWGFDGVVMTDWGGDNNRVDGLIAGDDLEMPTTAGETNADIVAAVRAGRIPESLLDETVDRLLTLADELTGREAAPFDKAAHHALAQEAAEASAVLLKNDGLLPLGDRKVAIIGEFALHSRYQGAGSSNVNPTKVEHAADCAGEYLNVTGVEQGFRRRGKTSAKLVRRAVELANRSEAVVLWLGLDETSEAEGSDRPDLKLPANQLELLEALAGTGKPIAVVLSCGGAVETDWAEKYHVNALLYGGLAGQAGARALLRILAGQVTPGGKLAETFPARYEDLPCADTFDHADTVVEYREGPYVGYRYYETAGVPVQYPFGYGLSYTSFAYSGLEVGKDAVSFRLTNTGEREGAEIAQLYIAGPRQTVFRPEEELKGFVKVRLMPGQSRRVTIRLDDKAFRYYNTASDSWETEPGTYELRVGASSADIRLRGSVEIEGTAAPSPYDKAALPSYFSGRVRDVTREEFERLLGRAVPPEAAQVRREMGYNNTISDLKYAPGGFARFIYGALRLFYRLCLLFGKEKLALELVMGVFNQPLRGVYRMTGGMITKPMMDGLMVVINGHFFRGLGIFFREMRARNRRRAQDAACRVVSKEGE